MVHFWAKREEWIGMWIQIGNHKGHQEHKGVETSQVFETCEVFMSDVADVLNRQITLSDFRNLSRLRYSTGLSSRAGGS